MDRRTFIFAVAAGIITAPLAAYAQTATTVRRIGWLVLDDRPPPAVLEQQLAPLRQLGWIEGQNLLVERRYANSRAERLQSLAEELVRLKVELIVTLGTDAALAAKNATNTIPIVMWAAGDPVLTGLVASLSRPGGNITGYSIMGAELDARRLALMREVLPGLQRVGVLQNSTNLYYRAARKDFEQACRSLGIQPIIIGVTTADEMENAIAEMVRRKAQALHVAGDRLFIGNPIPLMSAALRYALPTSVEGQELLEAGGLLSYNQNLAELRRRGAAFIDKILRGAKPADLPIEQPTQFDLGINLKTAKALGITVPQTLLLRADNVIR